LLAGTAPILDSLFQNAGFGEVVGKDLRLNLHHGREILFKRASDFCVQRLAWPP
jgi:hypothetical protein